MKQPSSLRAPVILALALLLAVVAAAWLLISKRHGPDNRALRTKFSEFQGFDGDQAIQTFRNAGEAGVAFLAQQLKSGDSANRIKAVEALRQMGRRYTATKDGIAALWDALDQTNSEVCTVAEGALGDIGPKAKAAIPSLTRLASERTDINAIWALGMIGPDATPALPILESISLQATGRARVYAAGAVLQIGGDNAHAKSVVQEASRDPDLHIRIDATNVFVQLQNWSNWMHPGR
jgi:hypothetical protein